MVHYLWAWWLMQAQRFLLRRISLASRGLILCRYAHGKLGGILWRKREEEWRSMRDRHRREFMRLQAKIDACLLQR